MPVFPQSERVIYRNNTLEEVVCQLRFPPILRIEASTPADFQDAIRESYPLFVTKKSPELPPNLPPELARLIAADSSIAGAAYEFSTEDGNWTLTLTKDFLALTSTNYLRWEDFCGHLQAPLAALQRIYNPSFYVRIGLRYRNLIDRGSLNLECGWKDLITSYVLGELASESIGERVEATARDVTIALDEGEKVRVHHGLRMDQENTTNLYYVDADYYTTERTEVENAIATLARFNGESGHLFRWCITEQLHNAMAPRPA